MKYTNYIAIIVLLFVSGLNSCQKMDSPDVGKEIILGINGDGIEYQNVTKASAVNSVPSSLYWGMTYTNGTVKQSTTSKSVSSNQISTGYYQTASHTTYNHYVANVNFTVAGDMSASNSTDIIAGSTSSSSASPSVTMNHIFARTGSFTCYTQSGYSLSGVSFYLLSYDTVTGTSGTFNMGSMSWTASSARLTSWTSVSSGSDLYLIPGTYYVLVCYTLSLGDYSQYFEKTGTVTLVAGKVNNIYCTAYGGNAQSISIGLSLTGWSSTTAYPTIG